MNVKLQQVFSSKIIGKIKLFMLGHVATIFSVEYVHDVYGGFVLLLVVLLFVAVI